MGQGVCSHNTPTPVDLLSMWGIPRRGTGSVCVCVCAHVFESNPALITGLVLFVLAIKACKTCMHVEVDAWSHLKHHDRRLQLPGASAKRDAHLSARVPLDGLLDFAVGAPSQRLQQLVAVLQVVLVMVFLHA